MKRALADDGLSIFERGTSGHCKMVGAVPERQCKTARRSSQHSSASVRHQSHQKAHPISSQHKGIGPDQWPHSTKWQQSLPPVGTPDSRTGDIGYERLAPMAQSPPHTNDIDLRGLPSRMGCNSPKAEVIGQGNLHQVAGLQGEGPGPYGALSASSPDVSIENDVLELGLEGCENIGRAESDDDEVCFGMIKTSSLLKFRCPPHATARFNPFATQLREDGTVFIPSTGFEVGTLEKPLLEILKKLCQLQGMSLQLHCIFKRRVCFGNQDNPKCREVEMSFNLFCNIFGPKYMFEEVGDLLEVNDICLQDPQGCNRNVRYRNPHRLGGMDDDAPMTIDRVIEMGDVLPQDWQGSSNFLDELEMVDHKSLPLADPPGALTARLFEHQRRALFFMQARERGWNMHGDQPDIWKKKCVANHSMYLNTISDDLQVECPPTFRGGVLADTMGLGKTLEILALIAADLDQSPDPAWFAAGFPTAASHQPCRTLVVVPAPLLSMWEDQLKEHCDTTRIHWFRHHSRSKLVDVSDLDRFNVILTTYDTVAHEWKRRDSKPSILYATHWHRIVLDEAHFIRTQGTQREAAIGGLEAHRRWAVTGTPIQNGIQDFATLLQFLRVHPYDQPKRFEQDVINVWKDDPVAGPARAKRLISYISMRRTLQTVDLPPKIDQILQIPFTTAERERYDAVERALNQASGFAADQLLDNNRHVLQGLYNLRALCNFGMLANIKSTGDTSAMNSWSSAEAQTIFDGLLVLGPRCCVRCRKEVSAVDELEQAPPPSLLQPGLMDALVSRCGKVWCHDCFGKEQRKHGPHAVFCAHSTPCATLPVSSKSAASLEPTSELIVEKMPTKVKSLVQDICAFTASKSVVFSIWRETLNLTAAALRVKGIRFNRYDGQMSPNEREQALRDFQKDRSIKVILFTIQCGAVGLNLTAADRVYLMEPHWNPTVEEQALARVHRIGQTKPVTTIRLIIQDTYEDEIMSIQKHKKRFVDLMLSAKTNAPRPNEGNAFSHWRRLLT